MPTYRFLNNVTNEEYEEFMSISALEVYLQEHTDRTQLLSSPALVSGRGMGKPDSGFRDVLKQIKRNSNKGITRSTIETF